MSDANPIESTNSSPDDLTKKPDAQLSPEELKKVSGGTEYLKFNLEEVYITGVQTSGSSGETEPSK